MLVLKAPDLNKLVQGGQPHLSFFCGKDYHILSNIVRIFYIENDAEIFPAHYTWKLAEKGWKMAFTMNKLAINNSCEIIVEK